MPPWLRSKYQRPRLKVHGAWAFGFCLNIFVMDDPSRHDSSAIIEILAITIEDDPGLEFTCLFWDLEYFEFWPPKKMHLHWWNIKSSGLCNFKPASGYAPM